MNCFTRTAPRRLFRGEQEEETGEQIESEQHASDSHLFIRDAV
jgi:hypothetical protein